MKVGKIILFVLGVIVAGLIIIGLVSPKEATVQRTVLIDAPREVVWQNISSLEAQHDWSPWARRDENMEMNYEGEKGQVGSKYSWHSEVVGAGYQQITAVSDMQKMEQDLVFTEPFNSKANVWIEMQDAENGQQEVTWGFHTEFGFFMSIFTFFSSMDKGVGPDFEEGLQYLKEKCEKEAAEMPASEEMSFEVDGFTIVEKQFGPAYYIGKLATKKMDEMSDFFEASYKALQEKVSGAGFAMAGVPCGLYFTWDTENMQSDLMAAFPMMSPDVVVDGFDNYKVDEGIACMITYKGNYENLGEVHNALDKHMQSRGFVGSVAIEEYLSDPSTVTDPNEMVTRVIYPVRLKE
ncbi:hypothetical protein GC194_09870 [bacterium]|nr:hypothetical protein [bacterium]